MSANNSDKAPDGAEDPRLSSIEDRLREVRRAEEERTAPMGQPASLTGKGAAQGQRVMSALIGAPLGGALIGWMIDKWFETGPAGLLIMLFLGFGAAISQVYRISKERVQ